MSLMQYYKIHQSVIRFFNCMTYMVTKSWKYSLVDQIQYRDY